MATKTITATATLHVPGKAFVPFEFNDMGTVKSGKYDVQEAAPGTPVTLDEVEADRLIARGIATEYVAPASEAQAPIVDPAAAATAATAAKK